MKRGVLSVLVAVLTLAGCGSRGGTNPQKEDKNDLPPGSIAIKSDAQQMAGMSVITVRARRVPETLTLAGQIVLNEERTVHVGAYTAARVLDIFANVGDNVRPGAVLARMHSHEVHEVIAAYQSALQDAQRQKSAVDYATRNRDRIRRLYALKFASLQETERAETDWRAAQTSLANAQIAVEREVSHLSDILHMPESRLNHITEEMEHIPIVSPIGGVVTARLITPGAVVEPGQEAYTVSDLRSLWMMASVNEADIAKVKEGEHAEITVQAFPEQRFSAIITRISAELDPRTRTLPVRLLVPNQNRQLRAEMYATAMVTQGLSRNAIFVPEEALQDLNGGAIVFVRKSAEIFEVRPVELRRRMNGEAEIARGVTAGETVIVKGSFIAKSEMLKSQIGE